MTVLKRSVRRLTNTALGSSFGRDRAKRIVITIIPGNGRDVEDRLELRPERTRRPESVNVADVYRWALRCRVNSGVLAKARERKAKKAIRVAFQRQARAERRLLR